MFVGYLSTLLYFISICISVNCNLFSQFSLCDLSRELNQFEKENLVELSKLINDGKG